MKKLLNVFLFSSLLTSGFTVVAADTGYLNVPIFYVTDRKIEDESNPEKFFGGDRGNFSFGIVEVGLDRQKIDSTGLEDSKRWDPLDVNRPKNKSGHFVYRVDPTTKKVFNDLVAQGPLTEEVVVQIPRGASITEISAALDEKATELLASLYGDLTAWRKCLVARHPSRPHCIDYIDALFTEFTPLAYKAEESRTLYFCGCKHTQGSPLCDGTHNSLD